MTREDFTVVGRESVWYLVKANHENEACFEWAQIARVDYIVIRKKSQGYLINIEEPMMSPLLDNNSLCVLATQLFYENEKSLIRIMFKVV